MDGVSPVARFVDLVDRPADEVDLEALVLALGAAFDGDADLGRAREQLAGLAAGVIEPTPAAVVHHVFVDGGLRGDRDTYYDPANSYLHRVLERRRGIPVSLAVVGACVGRRLGVELDVVGVPGHVVLGAPGGGPPWWDAFDGGRRLEPADVAALHAAATGAPITGVDPVVLDAHGVAVRMLNNLRAVATAAGDRQGLTTALVLRNAVPGVPVGERAELATVLAAGGRFDEGARLLDQLAEEAEGDEAAALAAGAIRLRARMS